MDARRDNDKKLLAASPRVTASRVLSASVSVEAVLIAWFVTTPLASFYIRFPVDKSIITYNRAVFAAVLFMLLLRWRGRNDGTTTLHTTSRLRSALALSASKFEIVWALLSLLALISAATTSDDIAHAIRTAVDSFWLPLLAFHFTRHHFDLQGRRSALLLASFVLSLLLFTTGAYEYLTGTDLFQYKGSELVREGERRVNGPFLSDVAYAIICLLLGVFLWSAPRFLRLRMDASARLVHILALGAVTVASLLPLFRTVVIALIVCSIILTGVRGQLAQDALARRAGPGARESEDHIIESGTSNSLHIPSRFAAAIILIVLAAGVVILNSSLLSQRLSSPRNLYGRIATWQAAAGIAIENPLFGVGLGNYRDYFYSKYSSRFGEEVEAVMDTRAASTPHSNLLWVAAELGLIGFALYVLANVYIFLMGYRALVAARAAEQKRAAISYLALWAAYSVIGLTLASGYYSESNLYFFFLMGLLLNVSKGSSNRAKNWKLYQESAINYGG